MLDQVTITTALNVRDIGNELLVTGLEDYPLVGSVITEEQKVECMKWFIGLSLYWDCNNKALAAYLALGLPGFCAVAGSLYVWSEDMESNYGYEYNPPLEFHVWLQNSKHEIIDFALPGVIMSGLNARDSIGPMLVGREPFILAGEAPEFLIYRGDHIIT